MSKNFGKQVIVVDNGIETEDDKNQREIEEYILQNVSEFVLISVHLIKF